MKRSSFRRLLIPIVVELFLTLFIGSIDTFMVSSVDDLLVGAIGTANSYHYLIAILFNVISGGLAAVMSQYIGAKLESTANRAHKIALVINIAFGVALSIALFFGTNALLKILKVSPSYIEYSSMYLRIIGSFIFIDAVNPVFSAYLRSYGKTKFPMISSAVANIINVVLDIIFILTCTSYMDAVIKVAIATVIAKAVSFILNIIFFFAYRNKNGEKQQLSDKQIIRDIIKIGLPAALETVMFNFVMAFITTCLNQMDVDGINMTIYSYCNQISCFSYVICNAMSQANAIRVGWWMGEKNFEVCKKQTIKVLLLSMCITLACSFIIAICGKYIISIFTDNQEIIKIGMIVLFIDIFVELGRSINLTIGNALKAAGDATFTVIIGVIFMILIAGGGSYLLGTTFKLFVIGVWIGKAADEMIRGVLMFLRWKSNKWQEKILLK